MSIIFYLCIIFCVFTSYTGRVLIVITEDKGVVSKSKRGKEDVESILNSMV